MAGLCVRCTFNATTNTIQTLQLVNCYAYRRVGGEFLDFCLEITYIIKFIVLLSTCFLERKRLSKLGAWSSVRLQSGVRCNIRKSMFFLFIKIMVSVHLHVVCGSHAPRHELLSACAELYTGARPAVFHLRKNIFCEISAHLLGFLRNTVVVPSF